MYLMLHSMASLHAKDEGIGNIMHACLERERETRVQQNERTNRKLNEVRITERLCLRRSVTLVFPSTYGTVCVRIG
jgi:hypothetical protein